MSGENSALINQSWGRLETSDSVLVLLKKMIWVSEINVHLPLSAMESDRVVKGFGEEKELGKSLKVNKNLARTEGESYYRQKAQTKQRRVGWKGERNPKENCQEAFEAVAW